jgi:ectoine hydroxylase-related dioxygenase (phytanoyl-CoA dioxygenase family)
MLISFYFDFQNIDILVQKYFILRFRMNISKMFEDMKNEAKAWRKAYCENGYVIVRDLIDSQTLLKLREAMERITENPESLPSSLKDKIFFEREHVKNNARRYPDLTPEQCGDSVREISDLPLFDSVFIRLICYPPILDVLEALFQSTEFSFYLQIGHPKFARVGNGLLHFHRDCANEDFTSADTITTILCLDEMTAENGATVFVPGSHRVSDEEAMKPRWRTVEESELSPEDMVKVCCSAGSGIFFSSKIIHGTGHNRSDYSRRTILTGWAGANVLPTSAIRFPYQGLRPRSKNPAYQEQMEKTFQNLIIG